MVLGFEFEGSKLQWGPIGFAPYTGRITRGKVTSAKCQKQKSSTLHPPSYSRAKRFSRSAVASARIHRELSNPDQTAGKPDGERMNACAAKALGVGPRWCVPHECKDNSDCTGGAGCSVCLDMLSAWGGRDL
jgi:hypothetical protein